MVSESTSKVAKMPTAGWLERRLNASRMEQQEDDLDARIRGDLVHNSLGKLFEQVFSLQEGDVRESIGAKSLANSGQSLQSMFGHILEYVAEHAPWLERDDATAAQRRYDLIGLSKQALARLARILGFRHTLSVGSPWEHVAS